MAMKVLKKVEIFRYMCVCVCIRWPCRLQAQCARKRKGHLWMLKFSPLPLDKADCVWLPNQFWVHRSPFKSFHTLGLENYSGNTFATETLQPRAFLIANPSLSFQLQVISVCVLLCWRWCNDQGVSQGFGASGWWCGWSKTAFGKNPRSDYRFKGVVNYDIPQGWANEMEYWSISVQLWC